MTAEDFNATTLLLEAAAQAGEAERLVTTAASLRQALAEPGARKDFEPEIAAGLDHSLRKQMAALPGRRARLLAQVVDTEQRFKETLAEKEEELDMIEVTFDREEPGLDQAGRYFLLAKSLLAEEVERAGRAGREIAQTRALLEGLDL